MLLKSVETQNYGTNFWTKVMLKMITIQQTANIFVVVVMMLHHSSKVKTAKLHHLKYVLDILPESEIHSSTNDFCPKQDSLTEIKISNKQML